MLISVRESKSFISNGDDGSGCSSNFVRRGSSGSDLRAGGEPLFESIRSEIWIETRKLILCK